jgi:hypothetical protein
MTLMLYMMEDSLKLIWVTGRGRSLTPKQPLNKSCHFRFTLNFHPNCRPGCGSGG